MQTKLQRTDIHRPSVIQPSDYYFVACDHVKIEGLGDCLFAQAERKVLRDHMDRTGGTWSRHEHGGTCHVCGSVNACYTMAYYHENTNTYVRVGQDCAMKMEMDFDHDRFTSFTKATKNHLEAQAGKKKAQAMLSHDTHLWETLWYLESFEPNKNLLIIWIRSELDL